MYFHKTFFFESIYKKSYLAIFSGFWFFFQWSPKTMFTSPISMLTIFRRKYSFPFSKLFLPKELLCLLCSKRTILMLKTQISAGGELQMSLFPGAWVQEEVSALVISSDAVLRGSVWCVWNQEKGVRLVNQILACNRSKC